MARISKILSVFAILVLVGILQMYSVRAADVSVVSDATDTAVELKIGTAISVYSSGATYTSSNSDIAYVSPEGRVTGKRLGEAVIHIEKSDGESLDKTIQVVANGRKKKGIALCTDEIEVVDITCTIKQAAAASANTSNAYAATLRVRNNSEKKAKKVKIVGLLGNQKVTFDAGSLGPNMIKDVTVTGSTTLTRSSVVVTEYWLYSKDMIQVYKVSKNAFSYRYGTPDTTPPVISGFIGKNSYNGDEPYMVVYGDSYKTYNFFKYVKATDDRGGKITLSVNTKKVNFRKNGIYTITYTAKDKAGNKATAKAKIEVRIANKVDDIADAILKDIIKPKWSDKKKAVAIYDYTRNHITYTGYSDKSDWEAEAIRGVRYGVGDCFTYYSVARALLTRAGLPNITVTRYRGEGHHWWSMVYVEGGFYHYDCGPRHWGGRFCLLTDAQLTKYSKEHENVYIWDYAHKPKTPTKKLFDVY